MRVCDVRCEGSGLVSMLLLVAGCCTLWRWVVSCSFFFMDHDLCPVPLVGLSNWYLARPVFRLARTHIRFQSLGNIPRVIIYALDGIAHVRFSCALRTTKSLQDGAKSGMKVTGIGLAFRTHSQARYSKITLVPIQTHMLRITRKRIPLAWREDETHHVSSFSQSATQGTRGCPRSPSHSVVYSQPLQQLSTNGQIGL